MVEQTNEKSNKSPAANVYKRHSLKSSKTDLNRTLKNTYQNNFNINQAGFETKCNKKNCFLDNIPIAIIYPALFHIKMIKIDF